MPALALPGPSVCSGTAGLFTLKADTQADAGSCGNGGLLQIIVPSSATLAGKGALSQRLRLTSNLPVPPSSTELAHEWPEWDPILLWHLYRTMAPELGP